MIDAFRQAKGRTDGVVVLGAEMLWDGETPRAVRSSISWDTIKATGEPCAIGLRIAPYPGPFAEGDAKVLAIADVARSLLDDARRHGVTLSEVQIDFDCAQDRLKGYRAWLRTLKSAVTPTRLVITTLPAWLKESEFPALIRETDGYVLQVHSVPTLTQTGHAVLCDPNLVREWVAQAAAFEIPFSVALPTYRCLAGYDEKGRLVGVSMDSVDPSWPPGTRTLELAANADEMAALVKEWRASRPADLSELIWYRLPVATDLRNWRWPTLAAVMSGRSPEHHLEVRQEGDMPVDFSIVNTGEAEDPLDCEVLIHWSGSSPLSWDALPGWVVSQDVGKADFVRDDAHRFRLLPGEKIDVGWIRFEKTPALQIGISRPVQTPP